VRLAKLFKRIGLLSLLTLGAVHARAALSLAGYFQAQNVARFVVVDSATGERSPWLFIGDLYQGYMVMRFDAAGEVLVLERDHQETRLPLGASGRTNLGLSIAPNGALSLGGESITVSELERRFKDLRSGGRAVGFEVRTQPGVDGWETLNRIVAMLRDSGANQWAIRVIDVTVEGRRS
jgi:hypothetical protein